MAYRVGVDVGGTFTDVLLFDEEADRTTTAKVPTTPEDPSIAVLQGIARACEKAGLDPGSVGEVMHGTTVATNAVLTRSGATVGLVTTRGYRQTLQIARSFVPGGLGGWVIYEKSEPLAALELTVEADERISATGEVVETLDEDTLRPRLEKIAAGGAEAITVSLINSFANDVHERRIREIADDVAPGIPVSISSEVIPEMQEYERTITTVANSYVRPVVERYIQNLERELAAAATGGGKPTLQILRSDGGLASADVAASTPVNLLMSGPAGGVSGAIWVASQAGFENLLTFDMGGTSTDVCLVRDAHAQLRRDTTVGDLSVRAPSVDVRTVGAGGGSIAHVPELTGALRVGPQSAGATPGPAAYGRGGDAPTVTDANVVLGYLPSEALLGGDMALDRACAEQSLRGIAEARGLSVEQAAAGVIDIVNENMCGALRLVSVEQGYDPRDFALVAFGGAGPLHANALAKLIHAWPVIVPPGPGVLCAYGDVTTRRRNEASRSLIRSFGDFSTDELREMLGALETRAREPLAADLGEGGLETRYQVDVRYHGQGLTLPVDFSMDDVAARGLAAIGERFDATHEQLFSFSLEEEKELVNLRAVVLGPQPALEAPVAKAGDGNPKRAEISTLDIYAEGATHRATVYERGALAPGDVIAGPAIVIEMDSTTLVLPQHRARVDERANLLIEPENA